MYLRTAFLRCFLVIAAIATLATEASATHFRYGTVRWRPTGVTRQIEFTLSVAYRRGYTGFLNSTATAFVSNPVVGQVIQVSGDAFSFGDATANISPVYTVTSTSTTEDWIIGVATFTHTYASSINYTAVFTSCCRLSGLSNQNDEQYRLETLVNVGAGNRSPVTSVLPFIRIEQANPVTIAIGASDPDGDDLTYRMATQAEWGGASNPGGMPAFSINSTTGVLSWNSSTRPIGSKWTTQVMVEDRTSGGALKSKTPVDFIIEIVASVGNPPTISSNTGSSMSVVPGNNLTFTVTGNDVDASPVLALNVSGMPAGSTNTPALPATGGNGVSTTFSWTPTTAEAGTHNLSYSVTDENGQQAVLNKTIVVNTPPEANAGADATVECTGSNSYLLDGTGSSDDDSNPLSYKWYDASNTLIASTATVLVPVSLGANTFRLEIGDGLATDDDYVTITVADGIAPVADAASLPTVSGECSATVSVAPTATDACGGAITGTTTDALTYSTQGTHTITWTFDDGNGNTSSQQQSVVIDDVTSPVPDAAAIADATGECSVTVTDAPTATDNCMGVITATTADPLTYSAQGTYTINWTFDDGNGNTSSQQQTVVVDDVTAPVVTFSLSPANLWPPNNSWHTITATIDVVENCTTPTVTLVSITSDEVATGFYDQATLGTDDREFRLRAKRDGDGDGRTYTATYEINDGNGNVTTAVAYVTVVHDQGNKLVGRSELSVVTTQVYPNPTRGGATISYTLPTTSTVSLAIVDARGTIVRTLVSDLQSMGTQTAQWNGMNENGQTAPSGTYMLRLQLDNGSVFTQPIVLQR